MPAETLGARWTAHGHDPARVLAMPDPIKALEAGLSAARRAGGPVVVAGSLYLVGAVRAHLVHDPLLEDPPSP
jgi:hypothetical protein